MTCSCKCTVFSVIASILIVTVLVEFLSILITLSHQEVLPLYNYILGRENYELYWSDEFNGDTINESTWNFNIGDGCPTLCGWGNSELQYYRRENAWVENGYLVIEARREDYIDLNTGKSYMYTSARLDTIGKFSFMYGLIEIRAKLPKTQGIWPAIWLLGEGWTLENPTWPECGEIDIVELVGKDPYTVHGTIHAPGCYGANGVSSYYRLPKNGDFSDAFHIFALEWSPEFIIWFVDGQIYHIVTKSEAESRGCKWVFDHPFHIIVNIAVGGTFPGMPDRTTILPQRMYIDYIRIFKPRIDYSGVSIPRDSDNELAAKYYWPRITPERIVNDDFSNQVDLYNIPLRNPDDWYLLVGKPDLVDYENSNVSNGVLVLRVKDPGNKPDDIVFGHYIWLRQNTTYIIRIRAWSNPGRDIIIRVSTPQLEGKVYYEGHIHLDTNPQDVEIIYHHGVYSSNIVAFQILLGRVDNGTSPGAVYFDYVKLYRAEEVINTTSPQAIVLSNTTPTTFPLTSPSITRTAIEEYLIVIVVLVVFASTAIVVLLARSKR